MKGKLKRTISGALSFLTILSSVVQPITTYAAEEPKSYEAEYPELDEVRELLDEGEIVTVNDLEIQFGEKTDVKTDFSNMEMDQTKVTVKFHEAKNADGKDFDNHHADTYKAVYYVEPVSGNPAYRISRNIIVKEPATERTTESKNGESHDTGQSETEESDDGESDSQEGSCFIEAEPVSEVESEMETGAELVEDVVVEESEKETEEISETDTEKSTEESVKDDSSQKDSAKKYDLSAMTDDEICAEAEKLIQDRIAAGDYELKFQGEDLELFMKYQNILNFGSSYGKPKMRAATGSLIVKNAKDETGKWDIPLLDYIYSSKIGNRVHNYVKYIADDAANNWRLAYCTQVSKHFIDSTTYIGKTWEQNGMYSEISYAIAHGSSVYGDKNDSAYSTGNWIKDYYVTQTVIYCILEDYGFDGHSLSSLSAVSGYQDVYDCTHAMYKDVKKNAGKEGYGDKPSYKIVAPASTKMTLTSDGKYYRSGWYTVDVTGDVKSRTISLQGAPSGCEIVYNDSSNVKSKFYVQIPVEKTYQMSKDSVSFKVKAEAKFTRPITYIYESLIVDAQNITFQETKVPSETKGSEANVSITLEKCKVAIEKKDAETGTALAGAVYGIYSDAACKNLIVQMPATDKNGASSVEMLKTQETVYLKEITAPKGYVVNPTVYNVKLVLAKTTEQTVTNKEQLGNLTIYKEGEVLAGASSDENGTTFRYEKRKQKGAIYNVYAGEDIVAADGKVVYKAGDLVAENLVTGDAGSVMLKNLHLGTYRITEVQAPQNFHNGKESKLVTLTYAGQTAEAVFTETTFYNDRQKAEVSVIKKDADTSNVLKGGIFGLYAAEAIKNADGAVVVNKDTLIEKATTNEEGKAAFKSDLPIGYSYYVKELQAPENYLRNTEDTYTFRFTYTNDEEAKVSFSHTFCNERVKAAIYLQKHDLETGKNVPQGDGSLEHAVYGLFARKDIVHPDGKTGVIYPAGEQIGVLITDAEGKAEIEDLYLGEYFVKEITPPVGYLPDEKEHDLVCSYEGDLVATVKRDCTSPEQIKKQPFQIIKAANNGHTDADLLKGAGFTAYLQSSLKVKEDGTYDFDAATPVVIGENGATEIFTDEKGYAVSIPLPYGTYVVRETTTPHNYKPVDDFIVRITEHKPNEPQTWRVLLDDEFSAKLKITKQDDETKKTVLLPNTEFKIFDLDRNKYVEQVTTYPTTVVHKSFFTDEEGYLILPQNLEIGHYRVEEVTAPDGYTINENYVEIAVDTDTLYQIDPVSGDVIIEVVYENHPVKGELTVVKKGEVLKDYKKDFSYEMQNLAGAVFEVYAAEDIYTADWQKDESGNRILEYAKDTLVAELTTDENGSATLKELPLGLYKVVEKTAPDGFVHNDEEQKVHFVYVDQDTPVVVESVEFINERQKVEIAVVKKDAETDNALAGAEFGLYAKADILVGDEVIVEADTLLAKAVTGEDGKATFKQDLPFGTYYIKELQAPDGFVSSDEVIEVTASYQGQDVETVYLEEVFKNQPTTTEFTKSDLTTGVELDGATLTVLDEKGNVVDSWTSVKGEPHVIKRLHVGETYILREEFAPYGYLKAEEVEFTIEDTAEIQKVEMKDDVPVGRIIINKKGELLGEVTWNDMVAGAMESIWHYLLGDLQDVTFEVYAAEDIKATDGVSKDFYKKDELVATITTDALGFARADDLPLGKYYVVEKETANGFILDGKSREVDLTYRDQDTPIVTYEDNWENMRQKAKVTVIKKEKDSDRFLEGGVFALCAKEDILSKNGDVLVKADTVLEQKSTDKDGRINFVADLPVGGKFYVKEVKAPDGFVTMEQIQEFTFEYAGADVQEVTFEFVYENEATTFEITKSDLTTGKELPGAKLQVTDKNGKVIDEWVSGKEAHIIKELVVGETYTLTETKPADGYVTAESITFTVENTSKVQKVEMKDDVTKVEISKQDISGKELPGAKLSILDKDGKLIESWTSTDKAHYIEKLPIGEWT